MPLCITMLSILLMFSSTLTNPPQEKRLQKSGRCKLFLFVRIVNINIKTKFREPISLGLEAISLTLLPLKSTRSQSRFVWRAFKNDSSGQLLGTSPGGKCLAGWSWKNSKNNSEMSQGSQGITRRIIHQLELKFVWGSRTELAFPMRSDDVAIVGPDEYVKHDMYCLVLSDLLAASPRVPLQVKVFVVRYSGTLSLYLDKLDIVITWFWVNDAAPLQQ